MNNIYDKLDNIKNELDKLEVFNNLDLAFSNINKNKELVDKINNYNLVPSDKLRKEIFAYQEIREYKVFENEVNFLILHINQKLKTIVDSSRSCRK